MVEQSNRRSPAGSFIFGFVAAIVLLVLSAFVYLRYGHPPVATADAAFPMEAQIVHIPLDARIQRDLKSPPFTVDEASLQAGAHLYVAQCSSCHGTPGHDVPYAKYMYPTTPQLWKKHGDVVGVSDDDVAESYWKIENGIRLSGMPSYQHVLSTTQMWQIALLVKNADQPLSPEVQGILQSAPAK